MYFPYSFFSNTRVSLSNIISYYKFENNGNDTLGNNNLTSVGTPTYSTGKIGQGAEILGASKYFSVASNSSLQLLSSKTITLWFKKSTSTDDSFLVIKGDGSDLEYYIYSVTDAVNGVVYTDGGTVSVSDTGITYNTWHFVAFTIDIATKISSLRINNQTRIYSSSYSPSNEITANASLYIGSDPLYSFGGSSLMIDEVAIFNRVLTDSELSVVYNNNNGKQYPFS